MIYGCYCGAQRGPEPLKLADLTACVMCHQQVSFSEPENIIAGRLYCARCMQKALIMSAEVYLLTRGITNDPNPIVTLRRRNSLTNLIACGIRRQKSIASKYHKEPK